MIKVLQKGFRPPTYGPALKSEVQAAAEYLTDTASFDLPFTIEEVSQDREGNAQFHLRVSLGKPGRKLSLTGEQVEEIRSRLAAGESKTGLARAFKVSRQTLYTAIA